jgi:hypothetical protein
LFADTLQETHRWSFLSIFAPARPPLTERGIHNGRIIDAILAPFLASVFVVPLPGFSQGKVYVGALTCQRRAAETAHARTQIREKPVSSSAFICVHLRFSTPPGCKELFTSVCRRAMA